MTHANQSADKTNAWGCHYEENTQCYTFYDLKDGKAKAWIAAEVAENAPSGTLDPQLHRLIERIKAW